MKNSKLYLCIFLLLTGFSACKKYEEGGIIKKGDERIVNTWKLIKYLRNGNDETSLLEIRDYKEIYAENNSFLRTYIDNNGTAQSDDGVYSFNKDNTQLQISNLSSLKFSSTGSSLSSSYYDIQKLTKDEYWYSFTNGGDLHEFQFEKQ